MFLEFLIFLGQVSSIINEFFLLSHEFLSEPSYILRLILEFCGPSLALSLEEIDLPIQSVVLHHQRLNLRPQQRVRRLDLLNLCLHLLNSRLP